MAEIDSLNDPFECSLTYDNDNFLREDLLDAEFLKQFEIDYGKQIYHAEIVEILKSKNIWDAYKNVCAQKGIEVNRPSKEQILIGAEFWRKTINDAKINIQICSLSERYESLLMWAHYAENHKGICIEYDFSGSTHILPYLHPVNYTNKVFRIASSKDITALNLIAASLHKSVEWEYEKEWRINFFSKTLYPDKLNNVSVPKPKSIYLGARFDKNNNSLKEEFYRIIEKSKIPVKPLTLDYFEYQLLEQGPSP